MNFVQKKIIALFSATALFLLTSSVSKAQLSVNSGMTPAQLVQNVLLGAGVTATNITYTGDGTARGSFNGTSSNIGFASGVILSSGIIDGAIGPNNSTGSSTDFATPSFDPNLSSIATSSLNDAAILEFDFVPLSDSLKFRYAFGSEEYPEYVCSSFNDVFGFFITGPNPFGPAYSGQNIAIIPGSTLPVTINSVNPGVSGTWGDPGGCTSLDYSSDYFDNGTGDGTGTAPDGLTVQYDGFTIPLTARAAVVCGQTYHIKIAIADAGDGYLDSGVFLEAGSFSSKDVSILPKISYGGPNDSVLYEGCGQACVYFVRRSNLSHADTVNVNISGSAINGVDYNTGTVNEPLPQQLIFAPGIDSISYCINAVSDNVTEGLDTIHLSIVQSGPCAQTTTDATIYINEYTPLHLTLSDTMVCHQGDAITLNPIVTGGVEPYTYSWNHGASPTANPTVNINVPITYVVTVGDACTGNPDPTPPITDSAKIKMAVLVSVFQKTSYGITNDSLFHEGCGQGCLYFVRSSNLAQKDTVNLTINGSATNGTDYNTGSTGQQLPQRLIFNVGEDSISYCIDAVHDALTEGTETIHVSIIPTNTCVQTSTDATFYIDEYSPLHVKTINDTTLCNQGGVITLNTTVTGGIQPYTYSWTNGAGTTLNPTVNVNTTTTFAITVNDACNNNPDPTPAVKDSAKITVISFSSFTVDAGNDLVVCPGDPVDLLAVVDGGAAPYIYNWSTLIGTDTLTPTNTAATTILHATETGTYQISIVDICGNSVTDQVSVSVQGSCVLNIPNVITPDGQGNSINETFYIENLDKFPASSLVIYNRWGKKIYETSNYQNNWGGSKYSDGTYYYVLTVPKSGQTLATVGSSTKDINVTGTDDKKIFSGFFEIARTK